MMWADVVVALVMIALWQFAIPVPQWVWQALGVVLVVFVIVLLIRLVLSF